MLEREVKALLALKHPGIPRYLAWFWQHEGCYITFFTVQVGLQGRDSWH